MRKLTTKLAAVVLLLTIMCSLTAFSKVPGKDVHVECHCAAGHTCGLHTGKSYGSWENDPISSLRERRKVSTICLGCGKTIGTYYEYRFKKTEVMWTYIRLA